MPPGLFDSCCDNTGGCYRFQTLKFFKCFYKRKQMNIGIMNTYSIYRRSVFFSLFIFILFVLDFFLSYHTCLSFACINNNCHVSFNFNTRFICYIFSSLRSSRFDSILLRYSCGQKKMEIFF